MNSRQNITRLNIIKHLNRISHYYNITQKYQNQILTQNHILKMKMTKTENLMKIFKLLINQKPLKVTNLDL